MKPKDLNGRALGALITFTTRNGNEVNGTVDRVRHASTGTYLELQGVHGVYQLDDAVDVVFERRMG